MKDLDREGASAVRRMLDRVDPIGYLLTEGFHLLALFAIGGATVWAATKAFLEMTAKGHATIEDLLLLFIYLEIGSMVGIYFRTNHMPVRFLLYVGITALTRHMIGYVQMESVPDVGILILAGATLILSLAVLTIRYASARFPSRASDGMDAE
ncbi:MAG: phosphate-starvation-inducible PsiE family protein [Methylocystis sp.]|nr:phosphate-starvation-inducible PsiE family protein [Methylocystis sp.]